VSSVWSYSSLSAEPTYIIFHSRSENNKFGNMFSTNLNNMFCMSILHCQFAFAALSRFRFFHLCKLWSIRQSHYSESNKKHWLLAGVSNKLLHRMQVMQNAAAQIIRGARKSEHDASVALVKQMCCDTVKREKHRWWLSVAFSPGTMDTTETITFHDCPSVALSVLASRQFLPCDAMLARYMPCVCHTPVLYQNG